MLFRIFIILCYYKICRSEHGIARWIQELKNICIITLSLYYKIKQTKEILPPPPFSLNYLINSNILEDCRRRLQLLHQPGIEPGPHWPEAKHLTTTL